MIAKSQFGYATSTSVVSVLSLLLSVGCGGAVTSGVAVGKLGGSLSTESQSVPRGAEVCAYQESLAQPPPSGVEKSMGDACAKALKSDVIWRRSMIVLGAYSSKLESIGSGSSPETAGQLEAALTRVNDASWADASGSQEEGARDAVTALVNELKTNSSKGDLAATIKEAAPQVKVICDGLGAYLDAQVKAVGDIESDLEKKRSTRADRRCAQLDGKNVCVQESVLDRMTYAATFGDLTSIETSHSSARDTVASFCAAHKKLEEAAQSGDLGSQKTFQGIVEAVGSAAPPPATKPAAAPSPAAPSPAPSAKPAKGE